MHKTVQGYFADLVRSASARRAIALDEPLEAYLVQLLAAGTRLDESNGQEEMETLAHRFLSATVHPRREEQYRLFRALGDAALRKAGWFSAQLQRKGISRRYVSHIGARAYGAANQLAQSGAMASDRLYGQVFQTLAADFRQFADLLSDVKESTAMQTPQDLVKLYDRWRMTKSPRLAERLREEGVFPQAQTSRLLH